MRARVRFYGRVQGVFFRANTRRKADEIGVNGWVRNLSDGSVEAVFEGEKEKILEIIHFCSNQIPGASVLDKKIEWGEEKNIQGFEVRYYEL